MAWPHSILQGGISTDGMCPVLGRTLNPYDTRWPTIEGDARCCITHPAMHRGCSGVSIILVFLGCSLGSTHASEDDSEAISWRTDYARAARGSQNAKSVTLDPVHRAMVPELYEDGARFLRASRDPRARPAVVCAGEAPVRCQRGTRPELRAFRAARNGHRRALASGDRGPPGLSRPRRTGRSAPKRHAAARLRIATRLEGYDDQGRGRRRQRPEAEHDHGRRPKPRSPCPGSVRSASSPTSAWCPDRPSTR